MADELDWPMLEDQLVDYLATATGYGWSTDLHAAGDPLPPAGAVICSDSPGGDVDMGMDAELTVVAASRSGMWALARKVDRAMRHADFLSRSYVDEVSTVFGWAAEDPSPTGLYSGTATYRLTVRRQPEPAIEQWS